MTQISRSSEGPTGSEENGVTSRILVCQNSACNRTKQCTKFENSSWRFPVSGGIKAYRDLAYSLIPSPKDQLASEPESLS